MREKSNDRSPVRPEHFSYRAGPRGSRPHGMRRFARWFYRRALVLVGLLLILRLSGCMEHLFYHPTAGPTPAPNLPGAELVTFQSRDGTKLCGWFIPAPAGANAIADGGSRAATILHAHGNAGNINDHIWFTEFLLQAPPLGFNLFIFDYRGYGQSEGSARTRGPLIADMHAALDYLLTRGDVHPQRLGMYGQSLGGSIGLNVMAERKEIRCAVIESAFTSWRDMAACAVGGSGQPAWWCQSLAWMLIPDTHRADRAIARITAESNRPILIVHGDADTIIPVTHGRQLKAAGGDNVQLIEYPGGNHNTLRETHPEMERTVIEFFRAHLDAGD
jgi:uncharacterized protein